MAYSDFTLDAVHKTWGLTIRQGQLFGDVDPVEVPLWLRETLARGIPFALISKKARSEFIVVPILLTSRELSHNRFSIYSGQRLDVAPDRGLIGECDFILTLTPPVPLLQAPLIVILEAKKNDIESGLGQCAAQMVGARLFNENDGSAVDTIYGCVTTGEAWQFLRLEDSIVTIDDRRYYINSVGTLLAVFQTILSGYQSDLRAA